MDLERLICEVPGILAATQGDTKKALLATSQKLRQHLHSSVTSLFAQGQGQLGTLKDTDLPALQYLTCSEQVEAIELLRLSYGSWPNLRCVDFNSAGLDYACLLLLVRAHLPFLQVLKLSENNLRSRGMEALQLGKWPVLKSLDVNRCNLDDSSIQHLTAATWTTLKKLRLRGNPLTAAAVAQLGKGHWPQLRCLDVSGVFSNAVEDINGQIFDSDTAQPLDQAFMQHLSTEDWPRLQMFIASNNCLNAVNIAWLIKCQWSLLAELDLKSQSLCTASCSVLSQSHWPLLKKLSLSKCYLGSVGMSRLALGKWPMLTYLDLSSNSLDVDAITLLATADWPCLEMLWLKQNALDADCIKELIKGKWPLLKHLDVSCPDLDVMAVSFLCLGSWPCLECVVLPGNRHMSNIV